MQLFRRVVEEKEAGDLNACVRLLVRTNAVQLDGVDASYRVIESRDGRNGAPDNVLPPVHLCSVKSSGGDSMSRYLLLDESSSMSIAPVEDNIA